MRIAPRQSVYMSRARPRVSNSGCARGSEAHLKLYSSERDGPEERRRACDTRKPSEDQFDPPGRGVSPWPTRRDTAWKRGVPVLVVNPASRAGSSTARETEVATTIVVVEDFPGLAATEAIFLGERTGRFYARRRRYLGVLTRRGASYVASTIVNMPTNRLRVVLSSAAW